MSRKRYLPLIGILLVCMLFCGAVKTDDHEDEYARNEEYAHIILNAFMKGDSDLILELLELKDVTAFLNEFERASEYFAGTVGYDLVVVQNRSYTQEGQQLFRSNYRVTFSNEQVCNVSVTRVQGTDKVLGFELNPTDEKAENLAPGWLVGFLLLLTLACLAFMIWMIVDCIRRPMKRWQKVLWILAILAWGGVAPQWCSQGWYIWFKLSMFLSNSGISLIGGLWRLQVMLPVGAVVYFFLRKKISARYLAARKAYYDARAPLDFTLDDHQ